MQIIKGILCIKIYEVLCGKKKRKYSLRFLGPLPTSNFYACISLWKTCFCYFRKTKVFLCTKWNEVTSDCHFQTEICFLMCNVALFKEIFNLIQKGQLKITCLLLGLHACLQCNTHFYRIRLYRKKEESMSLRKSFTISNSWIFCIFFAAVGKPVGSIHAGSWDFMGKSNGKMPPY